MRRPLFLFLLFFLFLTTFNPKLDRIEISNVNIKKIIIEGTEVVEKNKIKENLAFLYNMNLLTLSNEDIEKKIKVEDFIDSYSIKKIYPRTFKLIIVEKVPIAILVNAKKKYYISNKGSLIKYKEIEKFDNLPTVLNGGDHFNQMYKDLKKINFPTEIIKSYHFFESGRWDLIIKEKKLVKLPQKNYLSSLEHFIKMKRSKNYKNYILFDYRIKDQIILK